jgi:hypothetical protein
MVMADRDPPDPGRLRPRLRTFRDEKGRELFDVLDGPLPDPETPAPVRFLPEYDNILLSHDDRSRIGDPAARAGPFWKGYLLVDGFGVGTWKVERQPRVATLLVKQYRPIRTAERAEVRDEGERLLAFLAAEATTRRFELV